MKKLTLSALCIIGFSLPAFAKINALDITNPTTYLSSYGGVHKVRPYVRKNGTYVQGHRSGNPRSGVHCHNNVCY